MKILSIETSCDETAVAVLTCEGTLDNPKFKILGNSLYSQIDIHKDYGGVYPNLARREHALNLVPLLIRTLKEAGLYKEKTEDKSISEENLTRLKEILNKEPELYKLFIENLNKIEIPDIDIIAVTEGPGLAPALWVGINFSEALKFFWNKEVIPVNHMEGHIWSVLLDHKEKIQFPALSLLVSGGHTELVYIKDFKDFEVIGRTRDDAVGEAYDKVARLLGLPYPGGPEISRLAESYRKKNLKPDIKFPEPMVNSHDFDFSYSGLKTAVLYKIRNYDDLSLNLKEEIAYAFEEAALNVLVSKTERALETFQAKTLIVGGGVIANQELRRRINDLPGKNTNLKVLLPEKDLSTDNAVMIGMSAYLDFLSNGDQSFKNAPLKAQGNLSL